MTYAIGIDVGGTNIKAVAVTPEGDLRRQATARTEESKGSWEENIRRILADFEAGEGAPPMGVGLAAPGFAHPSGRYIAWMQGRLDFVQGLDWTEFLNLGHVVPVLNDANAALLGEAWKGAAAGSQNVMLLTLGTGVGGGALVDGRLLRGHIGRGGHLGHTSLDPDGEKDITGTPGSLEDAIGDHTVGKRSGGRFPSTEALVEAYRAGDSFASEVWLRSVKALAAGMTGLINVLDPEVAILGGGIAAGAGDALFAPLHAFLNEWEWRPTGSRVQVVPARLGEWAGAYGAAYHALGS
ncbi:MAG: ROK family protein [Armatimonadetes bacterium]|nr:ROK family protein [Armatimonadota bacterium]